MFKLGVVHLINMCIISSSASSSGMRITDPLRCDPTYIARPWNFLSDFLWKAMYPLNFGGFHFRFNSLHIAISIFCDSRISFIEGFLLLIDLQFMESMFKLINLSFPFFDFFLPFLGSM